MYHTQAELKSMAQDQVWSTLQTSILNSAPSSMLRALSLPPMLLDYGFDMNRPTPLP